MKTKIKLAFDSNLLHAQINIKNAPERLKNDLSAFFVILENKQKNGLEIIFLDMPWRETIGKNKLKPSEYETIMKFVDKIVHISRFPAVLPVAVAGQGDIDRQAEYMNFGNYGERHKTGDAIVVSDAVGAGCEYLLTVDYQLINKKDFLNFAKNEIVVIAPSEFLKIIKP